MMRVLSFNYPAPGEHAASHAHPARPQNEFSASFHMAAGPQRAAPRSAVYAARVSKIPPLPALLGCPRTIATFAARWQGAPRALLPQRNARHLRKALLVARSVGQQAPGRLLRAVRGAGRRGAGERPTRLGAQSMQSLPCATRAVSGAQCAAPILHGAGSGTKPGANSIKTTKKAAPGRPQHSPAPA